MSAGGEVLFVADLGPETGLGHIARSSALAVALRSQDVEVSCRALGREAQWWLGVSWDPVEEGDLEPLAREFAAIVLDSYRIAPATLGALSEVAPLVLFHDLGDPPPGPALIVDPASPEPSRADRLHGLDYVCLGPHFWGLPVRDRAGAVEHVLVSTGATDPGARAASWASIAAQALPGAAVELLAGPFSRLEAPAGVGLVEPTQRMRELLQRTDLLLCAAGQTMLEACAVGTPCVVAPLAENQLSAAKGLEGRGAVCVVDPADDVAIGRGLRELAADSGRRESISQAARSAVDGYGALRVAYRVAELIPRG